MKREREITAEQRAKIERIIETCNIAQKGVDYIKELKKEIDEQNNVIRKSC